MIRREKGQGHNTEYRSCHQGKRAKGKLVPGPLCYHIGFPFSMRWEDSEGCPCSRQRNGDREATARPPFHSAIDQHSRIQC